MTILLTFHSYDGQTAKIANRIAARLRGASFEVDLVEVGAAPAPRGYEALVVGDSIRFERHNRKLVHYLQRHRGDMANLPVAMFQVSMTSAGTDTDHVEKAAELVRKLVERVDVQPAVVEMFAGAITYSRYGWITKRVRRSIARREGNATDMSRDHEYTDWAAVDRFADRVDEVIRAGRPSLPPSSSGSGRSSQP